MGVRQAHEIKMAQCDIVWKLLLRATASAGRGLNCLKLFETAGHWAIRFGA
jgi:hypothetical protein